MDIRSAVLKIIVSVNGSWSVASAYLGMTENSLRNRAYETKGQSLSTSDALSLQQLSGTSLFAEAIAAASGGTFVKLPSTGEIQNDSVQAAFNETYAELGVLFSTFTTATVNGEIDEKERRELEAHGEELHRRLERLQALMFRVYCKRTKEVKLVPREVTNG